MDALPAPPDGLIACPTCDLLHEAAALPPGARLGCGRCGTVILANRVGALDRALAAAFASAALMLAAIFLPFIEFSVLGFGRRASVIDAALAYSDGPMAPLTLATTLCIIVVPLFRATALAYALLPVRLARRPARGAAAALRLAILVKPWAMAEVFVIGATVALVKVAGTAHVGLGPAFWALTILALVVAIEGIGQCERNLWQHLEAARRR